MFRENKKDRILAFSVQPSLTIVPQHIIFSNVLYKRPNVGEIALIHQKNNKQKLSYFNNNKKGIKNFPTSF